MAEVIAAQSSTLTQALSQIAQYISSSWLTCKFSTKDENHIKTVNKVKDIVARQKSKQVRTLTNIKGHAVHLDKSLGDNVRHDLNRVYVSIDGDNIGASVERAAMADDLATIISQSQKIESGSKLITKWAEDHDGDIYIAGGDDVAFTLPKDNIPLLNELKQKYQDVTDYTITIGVGDSISKAGHAMLYGKMNGKNQVNIWNRSIEDFVQKNSKEQTVAEKIAEHGLFDSKKTSKLIKSLALRMNRPKKTKDPSVSVGVGVGVSSVKRRDENKNLLKKSDSLEKDFPQIKLTGLKGGDSRPDQNVKKVDVNNPSERIIGEKIMSGYSKKNRKNIIKEMTEDPKNYGIFDPYKSKIALTSTEAGQSVINHEAHHKQANALLENYGVDNCVNLYNNMLHFIPKDVLGLLHGSLQAPGSDPSYKELFKNSSFDQKAKFGYQQELINLLGDMIQKGDRRDGLKDYLKDKPNAFNELDSKIKNTWKAIVNYAKNADEQHMNHKQLAIF
jgi:hypothetical protein